MVSGAHTLVVIEHFEASCASQLVVKGVGQVVDETIPGRVAGVIARVDTVAVNIGSRNVVLQAVHEVTGVVQLLGDVVTHIQLEHIVQVGSGQVLVELGATKRGIESKGCVFAVTVPAQATQVHRCAGGAEEHVVAGGDAVERRPVIIQMCGRQGTHMGEGVVHEGERS